MFVALGACAFVLIPVEYFLFGLAGGKLMKRVRSLTFQSLMRQEISWFDKPGHSRWYAKQFLHPDIVARYDYIFIWDEDLGVEHFNAEAYIKLVRKHGLEISQPGLEPDKGLTWQMTKRRGDQEVHKFVEIMATVFSRDAWRCNDLVHGWGLDFALRKCVEIANVREWLLDFFMNEVIDIGGSCRVEENMEWNSNFGGRTSVKT
ncbi:ABC transporter B family member 9 [Zea mays]|uniref:ABC transporter B family member 9 n=1 Tax=Zea mays TaxID=4577 RepID=A0A317Y5N5_MAIZE|nr:ABC transporter B family member 9 [Zea mays]